MGSAENEVVIAMLENHLQMRMRTGKSLDTAYNELKAFFTEPPQRAALDHAASLVRARIEGIEHAKRPVSLRRRGRDAWYAGPAAEDVFWPALRRYLLE